MPTHCLNLSLQNVFVPCLNIGSKGTVEAHSLNRLEVKKILEGDKRKVLLWDSYFSQGKHRDCRSAGLYLRLPLFNIFVCLCFTFPCKSNALLFKSCSEPFKQKPQLATGEIEGHVNKTVPYLKEVSGPVSEGCTE